MRTVPNSERKRLLALIHLGAKQIGLDDTDYRNLLETVTGKRSAANLEIDQLQEVLETLRANGFKVESKGKGKLSPASRDKPALEKSQRDKIVALWIEGWKMGIIRNRTHSGLNGFVKRLTKVERVEWLTNEQASKVIQGIQAMLKGGSKHESNQR